MNKVIAFLKEAREELKKVNWPSRRQTKQYTIVVIAISLAVAFFLGILDLIFSNLLEKFIF